MVSKNKKSDIPDDYKVYISEIQMKGNPTSIEEVIRDIR
jgi:hypothetical protein